MANAKSFNTHLLTLVTPDMFDSMLQNSFFLPAEILEMAEKLDWYIPEITVVNNAEFWEHFDTLADNANHIYLQPSYEILKAAKRIGVSVRKLEKEGKDKKVYVLCKLWME